MPLNERVVTERLRAGFDLTEGEFDLSDDARRIVRAVEQGESRVALMQMIATAQLRSTQMMSPMVCGELADQFLDAGSDAWDRIMRRLTRRT